MEDRDWNALRDRCGYAVDLMVDPDERGRGVGRRLMDALCQALVARGAPRVVPRGTGDSAAAGGATRALGPG